MKKSLFLILMLLPAVMWAQSSSTYLPAEQMSTPQVFLPGPPSLQDPLFSNDWVAYQKGKELRGTERGYRAIDDADTSVSYFMQRFGEAMGVTMTTENCPKIAQYISKTFSTAKQANSKAKNHYARVRPYNQFHEDTPITRSQSPTDNTSYPSGHTSRAWSTALALVAIDPDHQDAILKAGYDYGQSRVILGYHYQSDIDAARLVAGASIARLMGEKSFQEDMAAARAELENLRLTSTPRIRTVIISGQKTPVSDVSIISIAKILRNSGLFSVDIVYAPDIQDMKDYDLAVIDSDRTDILPEWTDQVGGIVLYHSNGNDERKEMLIDFGKTVHPVTDGLPAKWKHAQDNAISGKQPFSASMRGSARVFDLFIGHVGESVENNAAMQCVGFQTLLLRGAEWSATGKVTQKVPDDFPSADEVSLRPEYKARRSFRN